MENMKKEVNKKKQLRCKWLILSASSSIDQDTNLLSLGDIMEEVTLSVPGGKDVIVDNPPTSIAIKFDAVIVWERESNVEGPINLDFKLQYLDPEGKVLIEDISAAVKMESHHKRFRSRIKFNGLPYSRSGTHQFRVVSKDIEKTGKKIVYENNLEVKIIELKKKKG